MEKRIKNIIFDFDGTLVDTAPLIIRTMQAAMAELKLPVKNETECRTTIGLRLEDIPNVLWPELHGINEKYAKTYRRIFDQLKRPLNVECFPEVVETLKTLHSKGYQMAIASSRSHRSLEEYVKLFNLANCFNILIGGDDVTNGKPSPEPVTKILETQNWSADETLVVGDADVDIKMGKAAGAGTCAVSYGNGTPEELESVKPDHTISNFDSIISIVQ